MNDQPEVVSVNAYDARGEEGLSGDARVCDELGCRSYGVATALMTPGAEGLAVFEVLAPSWVERQWAAVIGNSHPSALRVGIVRGVEQVRLVASLLRRDPVPNVVVAPLAKLGGQRILDDGALAALREEMFPLARVVVIRAGELEHYVGAAAGSLEELKRAAEDLRAAGAHAVLLTGWIGGNRVVDLLDDGGERHVFDTGRLSAPRIEGIATAHATALVAHLARGRGPDLAAQAAQRYIGLRLQRGMP